MNRDYSANGLNQYTAAGDIEPSYDARGNLIATGGASFVYNARNQLWWAHPAAPGTALYYDPLGRMSAVIADNWATITNLLHDGGNLIAERDNASGNILRRYVHGPGVDEPLVWYEGAGISDRRWLHADERGSVIAISNGSGAVTNVNTYDESGIPAITNVGRFQYTGQAWIPEMGMYYYRARIYSPTLGRFMQTDPIGYGGGMNLYAYVGNDPVNFTDPSGHVPMNCTGTLICTKRDGGGGGLWLSGASGGFSGEAAGAFIGLNSGGSGNMVYVPGVPGSVTGSGGNGPAVTITAGTPGHFYFASGFGGSFASSGMFHLASQESQNQSCGGTTGGTSLWRRRKRHG